MSLAVIGPGFGRTGTMSLSMPLSSWASSLPPHGRSVCPSRADTALASRRRGPAGGLGRRVCGLSLAGGLAWRASLARTCRRLSSVQSDPIRAAGSGWWTSFSATIGVLFDAPDQVPLPPHLRTMRDVAIEIIQVQTFGCPSTDREGVLAAYRRRTEEVRAAIQTERLLVFDVAEGWAPLCRFLDVPVPDAPFPHMNSTEQFWKTARGDH
jgi:Sulfotransferase domain